MKCVLCSSRTFRDTFTTGIWTVATCVRCGLTQVVPMPDEKTIASLYHEDLEHFEPYIEQIGVHRTYFKRKIEELPTKGSLLDIGCAMGVLMEEAKKKGFQVQGVDISKDAVSYCRKRGLDVSQVWPKHRVFDVVTAFEVLEHEHDPLGLMIRIHASLKKGGVAILTTPNHQGAWRSIMGKSWVGYRHPEHVTFWDQHSLVRLFKTAGFSRVTVKREEPRPFPMSFAFTRAADYFPWAGFLLNPMGKILDRFKILNPINPWDDLIITGIK